MLYFRRFNVKWSIIKHSVVGVSLHWLAASGSALLWAPCSSLISGSQKVPAVCAINRERSLQTRCHASIRRWPAGPLKQWRCSSGARRRLERSQRQLQLASGRRGPEPIGGDTFLCGHFLRSRAEKTLEDEDRRGSDANRWTSGVFKCHFCLFVC